MKPVTFLPGQQVCGESGGVFRVLEWVGEGSYARVYRAQGGAELVALKLAKREVSGAGQRLLHERAAHAALQHAALPAYIDGDLRALDGAPDGGAIWLARQWIEGESLARCLAAGRGLPLVQAVPILHRIADALAAIHQSGWTHADLRPPNILLDTGANLAFLLDLGEAQPCGPAVARNPAPGRGVRRSLPAVIRSRAVAVSHGERSAGPAASVPGTASVQCDLRQLGELLAWTLTGADPHAHPERLSAGAGYHPTAVRLWQESRSGRVSSAGAFRDSLERLGRQLGLSPMRRSG